MQSLRFRLIAPFVVGTLLLTLLLSTYTYVSGSKAVQNATLLISETQVVQTSNSMEILYSSLNINIHNMIVDPHITTLFANDLSKESIAATTLWLNTITSGNEYFRDILIVDRNGICIVSSNFGHIGNSYANEKYIQEALGGRFAYDEASVGKVTLRFSASIAGPIDINNQVVGVLIVQSDFPSIVDYSKDTVFAEQTLFTSILNPAGVFTAHEDKKIMANDETLYPHLYDQLFETAMRGGAVSYDFLGESYIGYAKLEHTNKWIIISSGKKKDIFATSYKIGFTTLGISFLFLSLITFIVIRFANEILHYLFSLIEYAKQISEGKFEFELKPTRRKDELGILHNSLQQLVFSLQSMLIETQNASKMKGAFLANMSHEIRTPLNAIIGMAHLVLQEKKLPTRVHDFTTKIQIAGHSLLGLINDILDISKVEAGMIDLETIPFNLKEVISNTLIIQQEQANNKGITLIQDYPEDMPTYFIGDPLRIGQILNNLLSNALKFTKEGTVKIRCYLGSVPNDYISEKNFLGETVSSKTLCVYICVEDTGIGISEETLQTLFKPFVQADSSITRQFGGTGLGLAISERLVTLLHGKFIVKSEIDKGTQFTFFMQLLPTTKTQTDNIANIDANTSFTDIDLSDKIILIAEDNMINQLIMEEILKPTGATIVVVNNGQEAVDFLHENPVDLVFMDLQMPVLDGLQATKIIREFLSASELPIVAVTANAMKEDKNKGFDAGMNNYITKPIDPKLLLTILRSYFQ